MCLGMGCATFGRRGGGWQLCYCIYANDEHLQEPPHEIPKASCRAGRVVHLVNSSGVAVPVRIKISSTSGSDTSSALYVVEVRPSSPLCTCALVGLGGASVRRPTAGAAHTGHGATRPAPMRRVPKPDAHGRREYGTHRTHA